MVVVDRVGANRGGGADRARLAGGGEGGSDDGRGEEGARVAEGVVVALDGNAGASCALARRPEGSGEGNSLDPESVAEADSLGSTEAPVIPAYGALISQLYRETATTKRTSNVLHPREP